MNRRGELPAALNSSSLYLTCQSPTPTPSLAAPGRGCVSPRNEAKRDSAPPTQRLPPIMEMPVKQHLFLTMPKRHSLHFVLGRGSGGNLLRDGELSRDGLCLDLYLGCKFAAGDFHSALPFRGCICPGPTVPCSQEQSAVDPLGRQLISSPWPTSVYTQTLNI